ncbi:YidB family protein [Solilutibacter silvestris]|uniref:YidB family protein n=1 Tax=Solilutibacter silvestris TaxID=1645665 RepID=UPI003D32ABC8
MFDAVVNDLSDRYGLGDRSPELFGLLVGYIFNDRRGGFGGFVEGFREQGHGDMVTSWLGNPRNGRALNAGDVGTVFGQGLLNDWSTRLGTSRATLSAAIAGVLPRIVGELTPNGRLPGNVAPTRAYESTAADEPVVETVESSVMEMPTPIIPTIAPQSSSLRSPNSVPKTPPSRAEEMAAAFASPAINSSAGFAADPRADRQPYHRPSANKQRGMGWLVWLIIIAVIAGAGYYAWWSGQLDPWLKQFGLMPR